MKKTNGHQRRLEDLAIFVGFSVEVVRATFYHALQPLQMSKRGKASRRGMNATNVKCRKTVGAWVTDWDTK